MRPGWTVPLGQSASTTRPPVAAAAARKADALLMSGSMTRSWACSGPAATDQRASPPGRRSTSTSTAAPATRRSATVISRYGQDGSRVPT